MLRNICLRKHRPIPLLDLRSTKVKILANFDNTTDVCERMHVSGKCVNVVPLNLTN